MSAIGFVCALFILQMAGLLSGILGANYLCTIFLAMINTVSLLLFEGRRWRFFVQFSLFTLLIIPTYLGGVPFFVQGRIHFIIVAFFADLVINSFYKKAIEHGKLMWWSILGSLFFWLIFPFFSLLVRPLFYSFEAMVLFANVVLLMLPVIIVQSLAGGYLGYKIYQRVRKLN